MDTKNLTYQDIDKLEENLSNPEVQNLTYYNEYIIRLLCQTLRNNRWLADEIASADMRARLAFANARESKEKMDKLVEKNKKDFEFLMTSPKQLGKFKNKQKGYGGINV